MNRPAKRILTNCFITSLLLLLCTHVYGQSELIEASKNQNSAAILELLAQGADINEAQGDGATALHWSIFRNNLVITDLLLQQGANVNAADDHGVTPLSLASW